MMVHLQEGSHLYKVDQDWSDLSLLRCNCAAFRKRHKTCRHIYFVQNKLLWVETQNRPRNIVFDMNRVIDCELKVRGLPQSADGQLWVYLNTKSKTQRSLLGDELKKLKEQHV